MSLMNINLEINTLRLAKRVTPFANDTLVNKTNPLGNIPNNPAAEETTALNNVSCRKIHLLQTNKIIPNGIIIKVVTFVTLFIESINSEFFSLTFCASLTIVVA